MANVRVDQMAEIIIYRLENGIPPCTNCGNTDPDWWALDPANNSEQCQKCLKERPILPEVTH